MGKDRLTIFRSISYIRKREKPNTASEGEGGKEGGEETFAKEIRDKEGREKIT